MDRTTIVTAAAAFLVGVAVGAVAGRLAPDRFERTDSPEDAELVEIEV